MSFLISSLQLFSLESILNISKYVPHPFTFFIGFSLCFDGSLRSSMWAVSAYMSWPSLASFFANLPLAHGSYALASLIFFGHRHFLITQSLFPLPGMLFPWIFLTLLSPTLHPCLCSNLTTSEMLPLPPNLKEPCCGTLAGIMFSL